MIDRCERMEAKPGERTKPMLRSVIWGLLEFVALTLFIATIGVWGVILTPGF